MQNQSTGKEDGTKETYKSGTVTRKIDFTISQYPGQILIEDRWLSAHSATPILTERGPLHGTATKGRAGILYFTFEALLQLDLDPPIPFHLK